ncbi:MAG: transcription antitermination factor NusB [Bacteroidetes bacterium]|nr:transcription antitermination factor NusB [Bacteroidota bacterium]
MLNRRQLRVKVMQTLYAMHLSGSDNLNSQKKFLNKSMEDMEILYYLLIDLLYQLHVLHEDQYQKTLKKHIPVESDKFISKKFLNNAVLNLVRNSEVLAEKTTSLKSNFWKSHEEYVRLIYDKVIASDCYLQYIQSTETDFNKDKEFIATLYSEVIAPDEKLYEFLEDNNLTWIDDLPLVNTFLLRQIKSLTPAKPDNKLIIKLFKDEDDRKFAMELLEKVALNAVDFDKEIEGHTPNWDKDRIAEVDTVLIRMALCEFLKFPSVPTRVTINEYIEIAKEYATPKSSIFLNGLLDTLEKKYQKENRIQKVGRGLL